MDSPAAADDYAATLRRLHFAVAILVSVQLVIGLVMSPRHTPELFLSHQLIGLAIAALVLLHWLWLLARGRDQLAHLLPISRGARRPVASDITALADGRLPSGGPRPGLAAAIHGLGLLALTAVAVFGTALYILIRMHHLRSDLGETLEDVHDFFAWVLIVYWCGHVLLAVAHEARGDHVIARMFRLRRVQKPAGVLPGGG